MKIFKRLLKGTALQQKEPRTRMMRLSLWVIQMFEGKIKGRPCMLTPGSYASAEAVQHDHIVFQP